MRETQVFADFQCPVGPMKPMHAINNAPFYGSDCRMFSYLTQAGIPFSRLHDTDGRFGGGVYVDIANVFRNFDADPRDPASYDFAFTDNLIGELMKAGVEPFYRLGASIENDHRIKAYRIFPPRDALHWAEICDGIIRHYNEGFADGFHYGIRYWEIWNEPDNEPLIADNPMWKGTMEEYFHLYEVTARLLKQRHPELQIGGYGSCGFYAIADVQAAQANSSPRTDYFLTFFDRFLAYITSVEHRALLDFFSWHSYAGVEDNRRFSVYAREKLDACGLTQTKSFLNEWNPGIQYRGTLHDAAQIAGMMCSQQKSPTDMLMYYDGAVGTYGGLWNPMTRRPFPAYDSFAAFSVLYRLGREVDSRSTEPAVRVLAAADAAGKGAFWVVNNTGADCLVKAELTGAPAPAWRLRLVSPEHTLSDPAQMVTPAQWGEGILLPTDSMHLCEAEA